MSISKAHSGFKCLILNIIGTFEKWFTMELIPFQWQLSPGPLKLLASYGCCLLAPVFVFTLQQHDPEFYTTFFFFLILCTVFWDCRSVFYMVHVLMYGICLFLTPEPLITLYEWFGLYFSLPPILRDPVCGLTSSIYNGKINQKWIQVITLGGEQGRE